MDLIFQMYILDKLVQKAIPFAERPLENPLLSEIDALDNEYSSIENPIQGHTGDFEKYVM